MESTGKLDALQTSLANESSDSTVNMQSVTLSHYHSVEISLSVEQIGDTTFALGGVQSSRVKSLVASVRTFAFDYLNEVTTMTQSVECNRTNSATQDAVTVEGCRKVVKQGLNMILLDDYHYCSAVYQHERKSGHN